MFNPHIHQQQQQQQQFHQHLRQLQQLFQQQQPPPPPPPQPPPGHHVPRHHHQTARAIPVPPQTAPSPRMVNLCQATQTTIIAPNPMLQGALLMQQMQGNMRGFGMGGQQYRQFFSARSSLLGPVPMGMTIKSPMMGFPAARPFHPHARYYNNNAAAAATPTASSSSTTASFTTTDTAARQPDRKRDSEQMAAGSTDDQQAASSSSEAREKTEGDGSVGGVDGATQSEDQLEEPAVKKQRREGSETKKQSDGSVIVIGADKDEELLLSGSESNTEDNQLEDCILLDEGGSTGGSDVVEALEESRAAEEQSCLSAQSSSGVAGEDDQHVSLPPEDMVSLDNQGEGGEEEEEEEEGVTEGANKFYCYLCGITCHNQQNFRSHMNSVSHQQRMMEIQHMSNACLVTLLPRVQETLQGAIKDGEKKADLKHWCATCHTHFTDSIKDHRRTEEHKLASRTAISSCTVCKKHFRTSKIFVEHLQSQEHRQKLEKLQEEDGCEALGNQADINTDGFSLEEMEGSEVEEEEGQRDEGDQDSLDKQDGWSSLNEVTLKEMASDEQYDPNTVYGSSFFVPVAGFICRLCNKFYHFESSALHTHCKSLKHFENLKRCRELLTQKSEAVESTESLLAANSLRPGRETTTDCSDETFLSGDSSTVANLKSRLPTIALTRLSMRAHKQQEDEEAKADPTSQDITSPSATDQGVSLHSQEEETTSQASEAQKSPAEQPADSIEEPESEPAAATKVDEEEEEKKEAPANEQEGEKEAPAAPGKKSSTGKAKATPKRRSGRAANRR